MAVAGNFLSSLAQGLRQNKAGKDKIAGEDLARELVKLQIANAKRSGDAAQREHDLKVQAGIDAKERNLGYQERLNELNQTLQGALNQPEQTPDQGTVLGQSFTGAGGVFDDPKGQQTLAPTTPIEEAIATMQMQGQQQPIQQPTRTAAQDMEIAFLNDAIASNKPLKHVDLLKAQQEEASGGSGENRFYSTGTYKVKKPDGSIVWETGILDKQSGDFTVEGVNVEGEILNKVGETTEEAKRRTISTAQEKAEATGGAKIALDVMEKGLMAAETVPIYKRGLSLLNRLKTGGIKSVALDAKKTFGVEGADEGELSNLLGIAVLKQLKPTFGAAFTVEEGKELKRLMGSFGKSTENNIRLLEQGLKIAENAATRGRVRAVERSDNSYIKDVDGLLNFTLDPENTPVIDAKADDAQANKILGL